MNFTQASVWNMGTHELKLRKYIKWKKRKIKAPGQPWGQTEMQQEELSLLFIGEREEVVEEGISYDSSGGEREDKVRSLWNIDVALQGIFLFGIPFFHIHWAQLQT